MLHSSQILLGISSIRLLGRKPRQQMGAGHCCCQSEKQPADKGSLAFAEPEPIMDEPAHYTVGLRQEIGQVDDGFSKPAALEAHKAGTKAIHIDDCELALFVENTELDLVGKECALKCTDNILGDHVVPRAQNEDLLQACDEQAMLSKFLRHLEESIFAARPESWNFSAWSTKLAYAFADPTVKDCPLVYVSEAFKSLNGFSSEYSRGRNCRFLQPQSAIINDALNMRDRHVMREFSQAPLPEGTTLVSLLLNEQYDGRRFWNLLRMAHVCAYGKSYVFAVQTVVSSYMPKMLQKRINDKEAEKNIVEALGKFLKILDTLRSDILCSKQSIWILQNLVRSCLQAAGRRRNKNIVVPVEDRGCYQEK